VRRYVIERLPNIPPRHGFLIGTPELSILSDTKPTSIVKELNRLLDRNRALEAAIRTTLDANRHLADGNDCTLAALKKAVPDWT
jgi:hypothetical protein